MKKICDFIARWMGVLVLLTAVVSLAFPDVLLPVGMWVINPLLGLIMFGMGLTLKPHDFRIVLQRPKDILVGCLAQFTVMPLVAWGLAKAFSLPDELALGVILVGCCPGGTASNVITFLARGDLALSVGMTAMSTVHRADHRWLPRTAVLPEVHTEGSGLSARLLHTDDSCRGGDGGVAHRRPASLRRIAGHRCGGASQPARTHHRLYHRPSAQVLS